MTDVLLAAESVIEPSLRDVILARYPSQRGATVADLLDMGYQHDAELPLTEPYFEEHVEEHTLAVAGASDLDHDGARRCIVVAALALAMSGQYADALPADAVRDLAGTIAQRIAEIDGKADPL